ncbi:MAG: ATPase AAA [Planctomycetaceae bacterium]|nr:MAG: ATPase AAA [Planctomycetaceae bacterium]
MTNISEDPLAAVHSSHQAYTRLRQELSKVIVGQHEVIEQVLIAIGARGHALLEGVPGLAKTLLVSSLARALHLSFKRIQFTPDLMPSDITGADVIQELAETGQREYRFLPGPLFAHMILADEINRTPPKTQAAMLEAMQERQVSVGGRIHPLPDPFFVLATQNPLEHEGTYPLPEAQLDRFLLYIKVDYPTGDEEWEVAQRATQGTQGDIEPVLQAQQILQLQELISQAPVSDQVLGYAWALVRASRPGTPEATEYVNRWVSWGAGPRGLLSLISCARARAVLHGRYHPTTEDIRSLAYPVLRHRIAPNYAAQAAGIRRDDIITQLLESISPQRAYARPTADVISPSRSA